MSEDQWLWEVEEAMYHNEVSQIVLFVLDEVRGETSLFKLRAMEMSIKDSPLCNHEGIQIALGEQLASAGFDS